MTYILWHIAYRLDKHLFRHRWAWLCDWVFDRQLARDFANIDRSKYSPAQTFEELEALLRDDD